ncbi:c4-dicarboxylate anaerobic carrier family protein [Burkholderia pseudomallei MSHR435]|nr:c4-dicarboxylate anaerobic carrier family protein [Burkholderia pseudomallei MSHR435]
MLAATAHCADTPRTPDMPDMSDMSDMPDTRGTPAHDASPRPEHKPHGKMLHPVVMMIWVLAAAVALTWLVDSGRYARNGKLVVPGTYQVVPKATSLATLVAPAVSKSTPQLAMPASLVSAFVAVPGGLVKNAPLIVMVMFVDAGIDRLLPLTGNDANHKAAPLPNPANCRARPRTARLLQAPTLKSFGQHNNYKLHYSIPHPQSHQFRQNFNTKQTFPHAKLHKKKKTNNHNTSNK